MNVHGYIYIIENKINGKKYIGQTRRNVEIRMKEHFNHARKNVKGKTYYLHNAIRRYGENNFKYFIVCSCPNQKKLNETELSLILKNKTLNKKYGYNLRFEKEKGYISKSTRKKQSEWQKGRKLTKEHKTNVSKGMIGRIVTKETKDKIRKSCKTKVSVKCLETGEIFESYSAAARKYNTNYREIKKACLGKRNIVEGKHWVFADSKKTIEDIKKEHKQRIKKAQKNKIKKIKCVDLNITFNSITDAVRYFNFKDNSNIIKACKGRQNTAYGYKWKYA